jgi:hypothetical protein
MNIIHEMILQACWSEENKFGMQAARPWLRWFLVCVLGMKGSPVRESSAEQYRKQQWLAIRKEAGLKIDPESAELRCSWGQVVDPYGIWGVTDEEDCVGRIYFARSPGSEVWVEFGDLPDAVCDRLWARMKASDLARRAEHRAAP